MVLRCEKHEFYENSELMNLVVGVNLLDLLSLMIVVHLLVMVLIVVNLLSVVNLRVVVLMLVNLIDVVPTVVNVLLVNLVILLD